MLVTRFIFFSFFLLILATGCEDSLKKDISLEVPVAELTADDLIGKLKSDENFYREEILSVEGVIVEINSKNGTENLLLRGKTYPKNYIICEMNPSFNVHEFDLSEGETIAVKGILKGYLNDAVLLNCVLDKIGKR